MISYPNNIQSETPIITVIITVLETDLRLFKCQTSTVPTSTSAPYDSF